MPPIQEVPRKRVGPQLARGVPPLVRGGHTLQPGLGVADFGDLLGVPRVVGGGVQDTARAQPVGDQGDGVRLNQSALVMPRLGPRVREEHPHPGQGLRAEHVLEHVDPVAADQPDIGDRFPVDRAEQLGEPASVHLHGDHIDMRFSLGHRQR